MASDTRIVLDEWAIKMRLGTPEVRTAILAGAEKLVRGARARAPKDTGAGAASIHAEAVLDDGEWTARVSWDRTHYYMSFHQFGTVTLPARPFLEE